MTEVRLHESIRQLAERIRTGELSPVHLVESCFQAIERYDPHLNSFITLFREKSLEEAERASVEIQQDIHRGPLHGIPIALKDLIYVAGTRTTCGSRILSEYYPTFDATVTTRLKQAGAILIGKTNLHEFAFGVTTENPHFGTTPNPWDSTRIAGGSSGGSSVAVIAGFCAGALGTDTGGSVRIPSALCGNVGLKPTFGRISVYGVMELAQSLDCVGPMCRYVEDVALMMDVLAGYDPRDVHSQDQPTADYTDGLDPSVHGWRVGVPKQHFFSNLHPGVRSAVHEAIHVLETLGMEIAALDLPCATDAHEATLPILMAEASDFHQEYLANHREDYGADVREMLVAGQSLSALDYVRAVRTREMAQCTFTGAFEQMDLIVTPTIPIPAPPRSDADGSVESESNRLRPLLTQNTRVFNLLGLPAISVPCGFTQDSLPVGLQIVGPWWSEKKLLQVAYAYQQATPWHTRWPRLPPDTSAVTGTGV